jgi:hypothetical protein
MNGCVIRLSSCCVGGKFGGGGGWGEEINTAKYIRFNRVQASGVKINPECKKDYDDMHNRKMYAYIVFRISEDDTTIIVEKKAKKGTPYKEFVDVSLLVVGETSISDTGHRARRWRRQGVSLRMRRRRV